MFTFKHFILGFIIVLVVSVIFGFLANSGYLANVLPQLYDNQGSMDGLANSSWPMDQHDKQHTNRVNIRGAQTNNTKWTIYLGKWIGSPPSIGADGTIYILASKNTSWNENNLSSSDLTNGTNDSAMSSHYFLNAITPNGTLKWQTNYTLDCLSYNSAPLISKNGTIYIPGAKSVYAIDPNDGSIKWEYKLSDTYSSDTPSPLNIASDGTIYFTDKGSLYALNPDGSLKWETNKIDYDVSGSPTISSDGTIYVFLQELDSLALFAFNPDGTMKWNSSTGNMGETASPASIGSDGTIYFTTDAFGGLGGYYLFALTPQGEEKWYFVSDCTLIHGAEDYSDYFAPTIAFNGKIYVSTFDDTAGYVYILNPDGNKSIKFTTENEKIINSQIMTDSDGILYFVSDYVYAFYPNGTQKWQYSIYNSGHKGYIAMGPDGTIYASSETSQYLYAIK